MLTVSLIFVVILGACIGSFLNVVVYRLPAGQSIVTPPSSCPKCGHRLAWYDNIPIFGWIWLQGRCRYCRTPISIQYPAVEAATALLFGGWFYICYMTTIRPEFAGPGLPATGLIFAAYLILIAACFASLLIDAKYFIIPLELPWMATVAGAVLIPAAVFFFPQQVVREVDVPARSAITNRPLTPSERVEKVREVYRNQAEVILAARRGAAGPVTLSAAPLASRSGATGGLLGLGGLAVAIYLLRRRLLPRSFEQDLPQPQPPDKPQSAAPPPSPVDQAGDPHEWLQYPHARREMLKECLFLAFPLAAFVVGLMVGRAADGPWPLWLHAAGGVAVGYLGGGAVVWGVRILGTLGFGKEAMGLGDVHLMAAVGAVCGWEVAVLAFFVAPFSGLLWAAVSIGWARMMNRTVRMIPYGPHLAIATGVVLVMRQPLVVYFGPLLLR